MSDEIKISRQPSMAAAQSSVTGEYKERAKNGSPKGPWMIVGIVVVLLLVLGGLFREKLFKTSGDKMSKNGEKMEKIANDKYQAIFLTNGQVYFGQITANGSDWLTVKDIYYLQVVQPPLQGSQPGEQTSAQAQPQISLVKLGSELHGPVDEMHINRQQVLFWEDMKADGQVVKAIADYVKNQAQPK